MTKEPRTLEETSERPWFDFVILSPFVIRDSDLRITMSRRVSFGKFALLAGTAWALLLAGCSRSDPRPPGGDKPTAVEPAQGPEPAPSSDFAASLPHVGGPAGYVGSKSCRSCHEDQFASWHRSFHRTMTQIATPDAVQANFHDVVLTNDGTRFLLSQENNEFRVRMERVAAAEPGQTSREYVDARLGLVTGSHHMQVFWVPSGEGNMQIGFPFTWLIPEKRWVPRNSTFVRPPETAHRSEVWNVVCSRCHATGIEPRVDRANRTMDTRAGELGIACEACHGPGERHTNARLAERDKAKEPDAQTLRGEIIHPKKISPVRAAQICGFCHSMKWFDRTENWQQAGFRYRPGDDLEQTTPIIRPSRIEAIPGLADYLSRNPDLLRDFFWPDGMIRVSGREYNGLLESPCYKGGKFSCLVCHSLHESDPVGQLSRGRTGNAACTQCHERFREETQLIAHTRHSAGSSGNECFNCHMPFTTYGVLKAIRSHQVSSPRVADELSTGRPNACNLCHLDKPLAWTANRLREWHGHSFPDLSPDQTVVADSVRLALSGDAGQRVLVAWHFGWEPALKASGTSWIPPVLSQLLDDSYAAVRCVAERSLRLVAPNLLPAGYDYTAPAVSRSPVRADLWKRWSQEISGAPGLVPPATTLVRRDGITAMEEGFQRLTRQRDERPVRLRE
jgi:predicted CXXCH cytochrome family protein